MFHHCRICITDFADLEPTPKKPILNRFKIYFSILSIWTDEFKSIPKITFFPKLPFVNRIRSYAVASILVFI